MTYQYRTFTPTSEKPFFDQFDLYFYKPKSTTVGVKARFYQKQRHLPYWEVDCLECKFVNNGPKLKEGTEKFEKWKKVAASAKFKVYTKQYISQHLNEFQTDSTVSLEEVMKKELKHLNKKLIKALKDTEIKDKHLDRNPELKYWLQKQTELEQIFLIQKSRKKISHQQTGIVKAWGLYWTNNEYVQKAFKTVACESDKEKDIHTLIQTLGLQGKQNVSYPSFIEMISIGLL